jgi:hypothetical protein
MGQPNRRELFLESKGMVWCLKGVYISSNLPFRKSHVCPVSEIQYNVLRRVRELDLLKATVDAGVLTSLEKQGLDLVTIEKLLPLLEEYGLLSLAANNQQLLLNFAAPVLVEGAPLLLPLVAGAIAVGAPAFYLAAAVTGGLEVYLVANDVEVPLIGLPAGVVLGLLLVPLTAVFAGAGVVFGNLKK